MVYEKVIQRGDKDHPSEEVHAAQNGTGENDDRDCAKHRQNTTQGSF